MALGLNIILAAFGAMLCWGIGDFFIQRATRKIGDIETLALIGIIGSVGLLPFIIMDLPLLFSFQNSIFLLFIGLVTFIVSILNFEALKKGKLSIIDVILEIELPVTACLGFVFLKETLSMVQLSIIFLIFIGVVLMSIRSFSISHYKIEKGVMIAFFCSIGMGLINLLTAVGAKQISPLLTIWATWIGFTFISIFFICKREGLKKMVKNSLKIKYTVLGMGILDTLAWALFAIILLKSELAIATAITESYPAISLILGVLLNREKILVHQYAGAGIALAASFFLALV